MSKIDTINRFNAIEWHDSKLLDIRSTRVDGNDIVSISIVLARDFGGGKRVGLIFRECAYLSMDMYILGKRVCADAISGAACSRESKWIDIIRSRNPYDEFDGYLDFEFYLIPPGGLINILARDFSLESDV
jgi:hypothetical protein